MTVRMRELACYLAVGGLCAASQNGMIIGLTWSGHAYLLANLLSTLIVVPMGYVLHSLVTFRVTPSFARFLRFAGGVTAGFLLSSTLLWILHGLWSIPIEIASPAVTGLMAIYGFILSRHVARPGIATGAARPAAVTQRA